MENEKKETDDIDIADLIEDDFLVATHAAEIARKKDN